MAKKFELLSANYTEVKAIAGADLDAGDFVSQEEIDGFAFVDVESGALYALIVKAEKVRAVKLSGQTWTAGDALYWEAVGGNVTTSSGTNTFIGFAYEAAEVAAVEGIMVFDGSLAFAKA